MKKSSFKFSPIITLTAVTISALMLCAARWQWNRYLYKTDLLATYELNSTAKPLPFSAHPPFTDVLHRKVVVTGVFDYEKQVLITNKKHAAGPGFWLAAPFRLQDSERSILVSRGFIPYADREQASWAKYSFTPGVPTIIQAIVQPAVSRRSWLHPSSSDPTSTTAGSGSRWLYADIERISQSLSDSTMIVEVFLQRLGPPPEGDFPAEAISVRVPPSTHFGYTIEWILLALATLGIGYAIQAYSGVRTSAEGKGGSPLSKTRA